ncbi:MAG: hypothetical protein LBD99_07490 [Candidatus Margulisbacteria bacterium]|jgi:hypothetical protein|nr:hypothetical protein [Candidatus Margulisiibacteriota bacterium]
MAETNEKLQIKCIIVIMDKLLEQLKQHFLEKRSAVYEKLAQIKQTNAVIPIKCLFMLGAALISCNDFDSLCKQLTAQGNF